jgi:hypothetical protein
VRFPFSLERYLTDLRDQTAWAPDYPLETLTGPRIPRRALHRMAHLWSLALLDDRFETLLLPILVTTTLDAVIDHAPAWNLSPTFFRERLDSGACLLFLDGVAGKAGRYPANRTYIAE